LTDDIASAQSFYAGLFGWSFQKQNDYVLILNHGKRIGGLMKVAPKNGKKKKAVWLPSLSVANVEKAVAYVKRNKGTVLKGPLDMKARGTGALVTDPSGANIVLLHSKSGDPIDRTVQNGDWLWNELWSKHPSQSYSFYRSLGGFDKVRSKDDYVILERKGKWRAGIRNIADEDLKVRWIPVVRVANPEAIVAKAKKLNGRVLMEPKASFMNGNVAVIVDPSGALVIVQRWEGKGVQ
jgi:predicted enzyme related to lactoylglutathione lyase